MILAGTNQHVTGNTTFCNLVKSSTSADTLTFQAGSTQTVTGMLLLTGSAAHPLALRSSTVGSPWKIDVLGVAMLSLLDVEDCTNVGTQLLNATMSRNSGNNTGVTFP